MVLVHRGAHPVSSQGHLLLFWWSKLVAWHSRHDGRFSLAMALACDVNRYKLLLEGMLKNTEVDHPDRPLLQNAIEQISDVASFINDSIKRRENQAKIWGMCGTPQQPYGIWSKADSCKLQFSCGEKYQLNR